MREETDKSERAEQQAAPGVWAEAATGHGVEELSAASGPPEQSSGAKEAGSAPPARRPWWWVQAGAWGGAVTLLVLAVAAPWPDSWATAGFGSVPWSVTVLALVALVLLIGGPGARWAAWGAAGAAVLAAVLSIEALLNDPAKDPAENPDWAEFLEPSAVAPTAVSLGCAAAAVLCGVVASRGVRLPPQRSLGDPVTRLAWLRGNRTRARLHRTLAVAAAGALLGTLLSAGAVAGAERIQQAFTGDPALFDGVSESVPENEREDGIEVTVAEHNHPMPDLGLGEVAWQETLPGPARLTTCVVRQPDSEDGWVRGENQGDPLVTRSMVVTLEPVSGGQAVVGYDPTNGDERWRYSVYDGELELPDPDFESDGTRAVPSGIGQVGVTDMCTVHVLVDPVSLITLDAATGEVRGENFLPSMTEGAWTGGEGRLSHWQFVTDSRPDGYLDHDAEDGGRERTDIWDPLVSLGNGREVHLASPLQLAEVRERSGEVVSVSLRQEYCSYLVAHTRHNGTPRYPGYSTVQTQGCTLPKYERITTAPSGLRWGREHGGQDTESLSRLLSHERGDLPMEGCELWDLPDVTDMRTREREVVLAGQWCGDFDGPALVVIEDPHYRFVDHQVIELPESTELPLRPHLTTRGSQVVWLDNGTIYQHTIGATGYAELYSGSEPVEAMVPPEDDALYMVDGPEPFFTVTESGSVQRLTQEYDAERKDAAPPKVDDSLEDVAGTCAGSRSLLMDWPGLTLLALCETGDSTDVTAISGERLTDPPGNPSWNTRPQY